ncbi:MAG: bacillithiol biosynthesis deacetylase BshB1 [Flavobacteriales bacterium]|nr:bacillithiol biosynthesis deacetylase BshB1 [Flavobacteriales bacterium]
MSDTVDILAFGAHPDDVELGCGGTVLSHISKGKKVGIVDLTFGDLGTRGTVEIRKQEAAVAAKIMRVSARINLGFADGFFLNDRDHQLEVIKVLREYKPKIVLANAIRDRHPDHGRAASLVNDSVFLAGLHEIATNMKGEKQEAYRPPALYHYIQYHQVQPDITVDISRHFEKKMEAVLAHKSQFYNPDSKEPATVISNPGFLEAVKARAIEAGMQINVQYGEGFTAARNIGTSSLLDLI